VTDKKLAGITVDFENLAAEDHAPYAIFIHDLANAFHAQGLAVNVTIPLEDRHYDAAALARSADAIILMAYDQHDSGSSPGPIADQRWFTENVNRRITEAGPQKIVVALGNYAYDWRLGADGAETHTFSEALL